MRRMWDRTGRKSLEEFTDPVHARIPPQAVVENAQLIEVVSDEDFVARAVLVHLQ